MTEQKFDDLNGAAIVDLPQGIDFIPFTLNTPLPFRDEETGELVSPPVSYVGRFVAVDVFKGEKKNSASSAVTISLSDISRNAANLPELVRVKCEVALASLKNLLEERGVVLPSNATFHRKGDQ